MSSADDDERTCDACGGESAIVVDGVAWCAPCLHDRGGCCGEFSGADQGT
ncbi:hypothetical protein [Luteolibacter marinus]|nr:hypothetical protein [Luteolibacter marinus]